MIRVITVVYYRSDTDSDRLIDTDSDRLTDIDSDRLTNTRLISTTDIRDDRLIQYTQAITLI